MLLSGKKALVTGGSRGIGKGIVKAFLNEGASVYYIATKPGDFIQEYEAIAKEKGVEAVFKQANISNEEEITAVVNEILTESGGIDILVNNAGITRDGLIFRMKTEDWQSVLDVNLNGAFYITRALSMAMVKRKTGSIINISSVVGLTGNAGQCNYAASKAAVIGFTKSIAKEVGARGIRANVIAPGFISTDMTDVLNEKQKEAILGNVPMKRLGNPDEIGAAAVFLASDLSTYVTGQVINVDGGMVM